MLSLQLDYGNRKGFARLLYVCPTMSEDILNARGTDELVVDKKTPRTNFEITIYIAFGMRIARKCCEYFSEVTGAGFSLKEK